MSYKNRPKHPHEFFDDARFIEDVQTYMYRNHGTNEGIARLVRIDSTTVARVLKGDPLSLKTAVALAQYADLNLDNYILPCFRERKAS